MNETKARTARQVERAFFAAAAVLRAVTERASDEGQQQRFSVKSVVCRSSDGACEQAVVLSQVRLFKRFVAGGMQRKSGHELRIFHATNVE
jgi:hypothetical protein